MEKENMIEKSFAVKMNNNLARDVKVLIFIFNHEKGRRGSGECGLDMYICLNFQNNFV